MGQLLFVEAPQFLEGALGLAAGVDEDQRGLGVADRRHHIAHGMARQMPRPGHIGIRGADGDLRLGAALRDHQLGQLLRAGRLRHQKTLQRLGIGHRRRQADPAMIAAPVCDSRASPSARRSPRLEL